MTAGTGLKGMGVAGINVSSEGGRLVPLIERAKELGMVVIMGQIEGPSRRVDKYDEMPIQAMSPPADLMITRADVNKGGYFTVLAEENEISQTVIDETLDLPVPPLLLFPSEGSDDTGPPTCLEVTVPD